MSISGEAQLDVDLTALPGGVHPGDQSGKDWEPPGSVDPGVQEWRPGKKPFDTKPGLAIPVWERATEEFAEQVLNLSSGMNAIAAAGRETGRKSVTLWVPSIASYGCQFSRIRGKVDNGNGMPLNPGDSITIGSEAPVYVGVQTGQSTGVVYVLDLMNPSSSIPE